MERPTIREVVEMLAQAKKPNAFQKQFILWGERKLARWKQRHLSFGGRVTLIQSTLSSIPIYFLSFFRLPRKVADNLIGMQRSFLWGGGSEQRKIAWTKWETIYLPKQKGGLGIKDIRTFNKVLLEKWRWDLFHQSKELWARILASKYGG